MGNVFLFVLYYEELILNKNSSLLTRKYTDNLAIFLSAIWISTNFRVVRTVSSMIKHFMHWFHATPAEIFRKPFFDVFRDVERY